MEPRWYRIFIYITGACRLVNLPRLACLFVGQPASLHVMPAGDAFFPGFIRCASLSTVFSGEPSGLAAMILHVQLADVICGVANCLHLGFR